jgi:hypothetical protein
MVGNTPKAYVDMSLSELVVMYNQMANSPVGQSCGLKAVQNFRDKATGVRRCTGAEVQIRAAAHAEKPVATKSKPIVDSERPKKEKSAFGVRAGTNRDKLIQLMLKLPPKTAHELAQELYGDADKVGAMKMVMKGIIVSIEKGQLPYKIVKEKGSKGTTYALTGA